MPAMSVDDSRTCHVIHLVTAELALHQLPLLRALWRPADETRPGRPLLMHVGRGALPTGLAADRRVPVPAQLTHLAARRLAEFLPTVGPVVLHAWTPAAARVAVSAAAARGCGLVIEAAGRPDTVLGELAAGLGARGRLVVSGSPAIGGTSRRGLPIGGVVQIPPAADAAALASVDRAAVRARCGLDGDEFVACALPPVSRAAGTMLAAWGTLLLSQIEPRVRILVPERNREAERMRRLAVSCHHDHVVCATGERLTLAELVVAADVALLLPAENVAGEAAAWALAAERPLIVSAGTPLAAWVGESAAATVPAGGPAKAVAAALLGICEKASADAARAASTAGGTARPDWSQRLARYAALYAELAS